MDTPKFAVFSSNLGWIALVWHGKSLAELTFGHPTPGAARRALNTADAVLAEELPDFAEDWVTRLRDYAEGDHRDDFLDIDLELPGATDFQLAVLNCCRRIPAGTVVTYAELADAAGHPGAARAVGQVMATNRFPLVVPCHRVVAAGGLMGGYSAPQGLDMKERLLREEGIVFSGEQES
jgi:methylated-DNA-[protein]-cysteine S-methyltransferase